MLSPFIFGSGYGKQGFYGIQSMNFQMVMHGNANRAWRSARQITTIRKTATVVEYKGSQLIFPFITPHASDMLGPRTLPRTTSYPCTTQPCSKTCHADRSGRKRVTMG
ncbi:MAG: phage major capsid domain-containing protein, partial [Candidatus Fonsibacter sp.]